MKIKIELRHHVKDSEYHYVWIGFYISGDKVNFSTRVAVKEKDWNNSTNRVKPSDPQYKDKNLIIDNIVSRINNIYVKYRLKDRKMTKEGFLKAYHRKDDYGTFHEYAQQKLMQLRARMEIGTFNNHRQTLRKVKDYAPELTMDEIDHAWLDNYFSYLRKIGNNENTAYKNMTNLKKYVLYAWREGYMDNNPFSEWRIKKTTASCVYLTEEELRLLIGLYMRGELEPREHKTLEFFLFLCFSSLHVGDALSLKLEQFNDTYFIYYRRKLKNRKPEPILVPISDPLRNLITHIVGTRKKGPVFQEPYAEQSMNRWLKGIAEIAEIDKRLTLKVGRHTFATIYLRKTKDLSSLKEILGHSSLHETMVYAHVMDESKQEGIQCFNSFSL